VPSTYSALVAPPLVAGADVAGADVAGADVAGAGVAGDCVAGSELGSGSGADVAAVLGDDAGHAEFKHSHPGKEKVAPFAHSQ